VEILVPAVILRLVAQVSDGAVVPQEQAADGDEVLPFPYTRAKNILVHPRSLHLTWQCLVPFSSSGGRTVSPGEEDGGHAVAAESQKAGQHDGSDCTYDGGQDDMDGEAGSNERSLADGGGGQYVIRYEKDGEMERMLERQAELIGQYEEEEKAQREWEKQYNDNRNANKVSKQLKYLNCHLVGCFL
jgi:hypothetical protein